MLRRATLLPTWTCVACKLALRCPLAAKQSSCWQRFRTAALIHTNLAHCRDAKLGG